MSKGNIYIVSGPSGVGKGTVVKQAAAENEKIVLSISATTRRPRDGETDGIEYYFLTKEKFSQMIDENGFLEHAVYCDNFYGTPKQAVYDKIEQGYDVILEIDVQGGLQIMEKLPEAKGIFIFPPSYKELERRLRKRQSETDDVIAKRLAAAKGEISKAVYYDYFVVNAELEDAVRAVVKIIEQNRE